MAEDTLKRARQLGAHLHIQAITETWAQLPLKWRISIHYPGNYYNEVYLVSLEIKPSMLNEILQSSIDDYYDNTEIKAV